MASDQGVGLCVEGTSGVIFNLKKKKPINILIFPELTLKKKEEPPTTTTLGGCGPCRMTAHPSVGPCE